MEQISTFLRDNIWQSFGVFLTLLIAVVGAVFKLFQRKTKSLTYEILSQTPVVNRYEGGKLKIFFEEEEVQDVHLTLVRITNSGNEPIKSNDYERQLCIGAAEVSRILTAEIKEKSPETIDVDLQIIHNKIQISKTLLNKGDSVTITIISTPNLINPLVDGRVVGVKAIEERKNKISVDIILVSLSFVLLLLAIFITPERPPIPLAQRLPGFIIVCISLILSVSAMIRMIMRMVNRRVAR